MPFLPPNQQHQGTVFITVHSVSVCLGCNVTSGLGRVRVSSERCVSVCLGCNATCALADFIALTQDNIPADWHAECRATAINTYSQ